ncbi:hypothetical protein ACFOGI_14845 [Virgibacillus xinjiangensis]|uniref:Nucleotide kinase n=1 Tax=Virgibacillus xinjiangensis TaxID=393090 RepID=A0ABV7CYM3_9BACI
MSKLRYYVSGNTAEGFVNYMPFNTEGLKQVIILKHPSETLKTAVLKQLISHYDEGAEVLLSAKGSKYLDGIIMRGKSLAVVNDVLSTPELPGAIEIDLSLFQKDKLYLTDDYMENKSKYEEAVQLAYQKFKKGLEIHDELEEIYIGEMDFEKADQLAVSYISKLLDGIPDKPKRTDPPHRLFGTNTPEGVVNEIPHLIENISTVYHVKGRAGTGKSTFMKKIGEACSSKGYDVEFYHCSFDPGSIDMVMVRELEFCLFDSTDPHEFFPEREGELIIDLYKEAVAPGTDEKYADAIQEVNQRYKSFMKEGIKDLKQAGAHLEEVERSFRFTETECRHIASFLTEKVIT